MESVSHKRASAASANPPKKRIRAWQLLAHQQALQTLPALLAHPLDVALRLLQSVYHTFPDWQEEALLDPDKLVLMDGDVSLTPEGAAAGLPEVVFHPDDALRLRSMRVFQELWRVMELRARMVTAELIEDEVLRGSVEHYICRQAWKVWAADDSRTMYNFGNYYRDYYFAVESWLLGRCTHRAFELILQGASFHYTDVDELRWRSCSQYESELINHDNALKLVPNTNEYQCRQCKSRLIYAMNRQTRASDEESTVFLTCTSCEKRWVE
jgi:RNase P subunit RPR2